MSDKEKKRIAVLETAWAAGVMDARTQFPDSGLTLRFETLDAELMARFENAVGHGSVTQYIPPGKGQFGRVRYIWQTTNSDDTREVLLKVVPFLSPNRTHAAAQMIARIEGSSVWRKKNPEKAKSLVTKAAV